MYKDWFRNTNEAHTTYKTSWTPCGKKYAEQIYEKLGSYYHIFDKTLWTPSIIV